ncbi:hypothetical protein F442_21342 [Phytophthora nicotianae P10297]|uniref:Uncharacterized protein n=1 Tax=Phytophthora nicotianae P10297 TaxID=1317064 RepID=W2Y2Z8_PHYNI|nr:hypothetical protein F442_21342 [Phytophthora nicotianae P10297]
MQRQTVGGKRKVATDGELPLGCFGAGPTITEEKDDYTVFNCIVCLMPCNGYALYSMAMKDDKVDEAFWEIERPWQYLSLNQTICDESGRLFHTKFLLQLPQHFDMV